MISLHVIGLTPSQDEKGRQFLNPDYIASVLRSGALPLVLPLTGDEACLEEALGRIDGLLLTGGADVGPDRYGEEKLSFCGETAPERAEDVVDRGASRRRDQTDALGENR